MALPAGGDPELDSLGWGLQGEGGLRSHLVERGGHVEQLDRELLSRALLDRALASAEGARQIGALSVLVFVDVKLGQHALVQDTKDENVVAIAPIEDDVLALLATAYAATNGVA
jgi:hypothetical protein